MVCTKYQMAIASVGNFYMPGIGFLGILYCYLNKYSKNKIYEISNIATL